MSSWGNNDNAANAPYWAAMTENLSPTLANITNFLYSNTTANNLVTTLGDGSLRNANKGVGLFAIDANEAIVEDAGLNTGNGAGYMVHTGWNIVTTFTGGRAGRSQAECLVATSNIFGDGDGQVYANVSITLVGPSGQSINSNSAYANVATFTVTPTLTGNTAANITYQWQFNNVSGSLGWANVANTAPNTHFAGMTTSTLTAAPKDTSNNNTILRVVVYANDEGVSTTSANATLSIPA